MKVSRDDVLRVARLARLELSEDEIELFTTQLNSVLTHTASLAELDDVEIEPVDGATEWSAPLREESTAPDELLRPVEAMAPAWRAGFFTVPRLAALDETQSDEPFEDKASATPESRDTDAAEKGGPA